MVVLSCGALAVPARAAPRGVRLLPTGPSLVRFAVEVPAPLLARVGAGGELSEIKIEGFGSDGPPGEPALPIRVLRVAVPPAGEVRVRAAASGETIEEGVLLAPLGTLERGADSPPRFERAPAAYASREPRAPQRARLLGVSWMRNQRVATVAVLPADYIPASRRLTLYRRVEVEVEVSPAGDVGPRFQPDDPFEAVYREVLVNYEQGGHWRRPAVGRARRGLPDDFGGLSAAVTPAVPETSVFVGRTWIKIAIPKTGFYRVDFGQLRNFALFNSLVPADSVKLDQLRLFTWPGVPVLPEGNYCDSCDFREVAIQFVEDNDGLFNRNADYFYFFAMGASDWADLYDPSQPDSVFINHPYETTNYYYLTVSTPQLPVAGAPKRIAQQPGLVAQAPEARARPSPVFSTPSTFGARVHYEQDIEYFPDLSPFYYGPGDDAFWEKWFWRSMSAGNLFTPSLDALGIDSTQVATVRIRQWGIEGADTCFDSPCLANHLLDVTVNGTPLEREGWFGRSAFAYQAPTLALLSHNTVGVSVPAFPGRPNRIDRSAMAWIELRYQRLFVPVGNELTFDSYPGGGNFTYDIAPFTTPTQPHVFDVTDAYAPVEISGFDWMDLGGGRWKLSFDAVETGVHRYRIARDSSIAKVLDASLFAAPATSLLNLRSRTLGADYVLIYYDGFQAAADSLSRWRRVRLPLDSLRTYDVEAIPISALYDQFSGGRTDPSAIRNFLRAVFFNWSGRREFVTLLGDASYDFKNLLGFAPSGQPGALIPTYENGFAIAKQFATDDWLLNVDDASLNIPDFYGGRIPAGDSRTALDFVVKRVLYYDRLAPLGAYRNKVMLIADDNEQGSNDDPLRWKHLKQTAELDSSHVPRHVDRDYVYLHTYPDGDPAGTTKPGAKVDIKRIVNEGVAMFNFIGHGSPFKIADETVLSDVDAGTFTNAARPTLFVAASCDVGKFSDPTVQSLGERLLLAPGGGAIAVISATELAYSDLNVDLNWELYDQMFDRSGPAGQYSKGVAQSLLIAKILTSNNSQFNITNNSKYQVMGDAGTRLNLPRLWADITLHACDTCTAVLDSVQRGQTVTFRGRVLDRPGGNPIAFTGVADMLAEDSAPRESAPDCRLSPGCNIPASNFTYYYKAGPMYRGDATVTGGAFQGRFVVPFEAKGGARARVRTYLRGRVAEEGFDTDGAGELRTQLSPGLADTSDNAGPRITLSFASGSNIVKPDAVLRVDLYDPSGILITGHTLQNGIVITLDGNTTARVDITASFRYATGSYTTGTASWPMPNLAPGKHSLKVSAADNLAAGLNAATHRSTATLDIEVVESPPLNIVDAYLFPNPTGSGQAGRTGGQFVVDARGESVNALLRIYTLSGRLIRTLKAFGGQGQLQIPWNGLDDEGQPLANGAYFFRVQLNAREPGGESSPRQKAVAEGRFVVLNR